MCDKKNSVLFTNTECVVLSSNFKLPDESHLLLRVPRENNMYNVDLTNIFPSGDLTCLFAKATVDESNLWHRRLGHINFKTMNKLVKGNLVRGLPSKVFENNHTCVACKKSKQYRASCKTKPISSVSHYKGNQHTHNEGIQENLDAGTIRKEAKSFQQYVLLPLWSSGSKDPWNTDAATTFDVKEPESNVHVSLRTAVGPNSTNSTNSFNVVGPSDNAVSSTFEIGGKSSFVDPSQYPDDLNMPALEDITYSNDEEDVGAEADFSNLETSIIVNPILTTRVHKDHPVTQIIGDLSLAPQTRSMARMVKEQEPKRVHQAIKDPSWIEAMQEEILQFKMQKEEGINYEEVFTLVARIEAIRLFLASDSFMGFMVYQMDVKSAFLYGTIEEKVYVCQPTGFKDPDYPDKVYKVVKVLYGLHQAPRAWYETLTNYLLENGFQRGKIDQTLFIKKQQGDILLVQVYVDDIIFGSTNKELCKAFEKLMKDKFQLSLMGELTFFLGLQVKQKEDGIFISQDKYVAKILRKFGLTDGKSASTPFDTEKPLLKDPDGEDVDVHTYRSMIGLLMYLHLDKILCLLFMHVPVFKLLQNLHTYMQSKGFLGQRGLPGMNLVLHGLGCHLLAIVGDLSSHTTKYTSIAFTQKVFANMRRIGKRFSRVDTPLFDEGCIQTGRKIAKLDADKDVTLVDAEEDMDADDTDEADPAEVEEVIEVVTAAKLMTKVVTTAATTITTAQVPKASAPRRRKGVVIQDPEETATASEAELNANINWNDVVDQVKRKEKQDNTVMRYQALKRKLVTEAQARKNIMVYLKNIARFKMDFFRGMTYTDIRHIFEKHYNSIQAFLEKEEKEIEEEGSKRKDDSHEQRAAKKQRIDEEEEELKVPVVDYEIHHENNKPYYKIIIADGTHKLFLSFITILKNFDREDLEMLWKLVQERFQSSKPKSFSDDFFLNTFKTMFEKPNVEANIWREQKGRYGLAKVKRWKLFESCGGYIITFTTTQMFLLVEKKYHLTRFTLEQMLNNVRLEVEEDSEMSLELLRMPPKRTSTSEAPAMTEVAIKKLVADSISTALEAQAAKIANTDNTTEPRETPIARKCTYKDFMSCQPFYFNVKKMEDEFYNLVVKENVLKTYIRRFQELATLCPAMVTNSEKLMEVFIEGLPRSIEGNVIASKPQTLEEAINITQRLMDQVIEHNCVQETNDHKQKFNDSRNTNNNNNYPNDHNNNNHSNNRNNNNYLDNRNNNNRNNNHCQQQNRKQETFRTYTAINGSLM
nr:hypothetical protein [Tanacetum cinerariifolium]